MQDRFKTKKQLIEELASLRAQLEPGNGEGEGTIRPEASPIIPTELYAMIFDQFPLGIFVIRKDGSLIYVNSTFVQLTGYTHSDIDSEKKWFQKAYPDTEYRRKALYVWVKYQTQQIITEKVFQVACKDGKFKTIEFSMIKVSDGTVISILMDVTSRGEAEELLSEKEERWRVLLDTMKEGFITFNALGIPVFVNQHFCEMTGYTQEEIIGRPASAFLDAENLRIFQSEFSRRSSGHLSPYEIVFKRKDGSPIDFLVSPRPLYDSTGRFAGSIGTCMDITERKTMEEALRQSEERYRTILGTIEDGYNEVDLAGRFTFFNESFQEIIGYDHDELLGMHYRHYADEKNQGQVYEAYHQVYKTGIPMKNFEWEITRKDGSKRSIEVSVSLIRDVAGCPKGFRGIVRDTTDRKAIEEALRRSEAKYRDIFINSTKKLKKSK
ncbi:MAG: PAS domain-containing protein [Syntrophus sp. (in: bacteria)]